MCNQFLTSTSIYILQAEQFYRQNRKLLDQFQHCEGNKIPWALVIGASEIENNVVKIRNVVTREEIEVIL